MLGVGIAHIAALDPLRKNSIHGRATWLHKYTDKSQNYSLSDLQIYTHIPSTSHV